MGKSQKVLFQGVQQRTHNAWKEKEINNFFHKPSPPHAHESDLNMVDEDQDRVDSHYSQPLSTISPLPDTDVLTWIAVVPQKANLNCPFPSTHKLPVLKITLSTRNDAMEDVQSGLSAMISK